MRGWLPILLFLGGCSTTTELVVREPADVRVERRPGVALRLPSKAEASLLPGRGDYRDDDGWPRLVGRAELSVVEPSTIVERGAPPRFAHGEVRLRVDLKRLARCRRTRPCTRLDRTVELVTPMSNVVSLRTR
jgi:hypothetical protein